MEPYFFDTIEEFKKTQPPGSLIIQAFKEIRPSRRNWVSTLLLFGLSTYVSLNISFAEETVGLVSTIVNHLIEIQLTIFSCVFAVYSILLAFLSDGYMKRLAKVKLANKTSMLKRSITYYESILFLYFINIGLSGILLVLTDFLPLDASLTSNLLLDNALASIGLLIYFLFSFRVFYEVKSTIYNTVVLFRASIAYRFLDFSVEDSDEISSDESEK